MAGMETIVSWSHSTICLFLAMCCSLCAPAKESMSGLQNAEVLSLTYGSIVRQLITDHEDMEEVNKQLDRM